MKPTAAPFFRSDVGDRLGEVPAVTMKVLRVVLPLTAGMVLRLGEDDGSVLPRARTVTVGVLDPGVQDPSRYPRGVAARHRPVPRRKLNEVEGIGDRIQGNALDTLPVLFFATWKNPDVSDGDADLRRILGERSIASTG